MNFVKKDGIYMPKPTIGSPEYYINRHKVDYIKATEIGFTVIEVLPFLKGKRWGQIPLNWIQSLRPNSVRVSRDEITTDSITWRVTVFIDKDNIIQKIQQEVEVNVEGLDDKCGRGLEIATKEYN